MLVSERQAGFPGSPDLRGYRERNMRDRLRAGCRKLFGRFFKSDAGATAVEFALVAFPFFYVLGCICETGLMLFTEYVLQNSVQDAARLVRTGQVTASDGTLLISAADFKTDVCKTVSIIINCEGDVT